MRRTLLFVLLSILVSASLAGAQQLSGGKDKDREAANDLAKPLGIKDRAAGIHNASNIGLFFENRGKLYPRRLSQGPSGEYPYGSGRHYIYRINPFVGIPGNVIQGRFTTNEEWEAVGGYHNPAFAKVAMSDDPSSWPATGWPVRDAAGNPIIKSDQDAFCVYSDSNNTVKRLGVHIAQTSYAFGLKSLEDMIFFAFDVINKGESDLDSLYFALYVDIDVGNVSGGDPEYADDHVAFEESLNLLYFYDDGYTSEWVGNTTGYFGCAFLKTPVVDGKQLGVTDWHYNLYDDDMDLDTVQYRIMSSDPRLFSSPLGNRYFHVGNLPTLHYDDPNTIPASGLDVVATMSSGPYTLKVGDTLTFMTAIVAGKDLGQLLSNTLMALKAAELNFEMAKPPSPPALTAVAGDGRVTLYWDNRPESERDPFSNRLDFQGYRLYKSIDGGVHWDQIDRNENPNVGPDPVPLAEFDVIDGIGLDTGLQYSYVDTNVVNGFEYWYTITSYDQGDSTVESLESPRGNTLAAINTVAATPRSEPLDLVPGAVGSIEHAGPSDFFLAVSLADARQCGGFQYEVSFPPVARIVRGNLNTQALVTVVDAALVSGDVYGVTFDDAGRLRIRNQTQGRDVIVGHAYVSGETVQFEGLALTLVDPDPDAPPTLVPEPGDSLVIQTGIRAQRSDGTEVLSPRIVEWKRWLATTDGLLLQVIPSGYFDPVARVSGAAMVELTPTVVDKSKIIEMIYTLSFADPVTSAGGKQRAVLQVTNWSGQVVARSDSLPSGGSVAFGGIAVRIVFDEKSAPGAGNVFRIRTNIPDPPRASDRYTFAVQAPSTGGRLRDEDLAKVKVVPNPYVVSSLFEPEFGELRREPLRQIQFIHLPAECTIHVFTLDGDLIKTIHHTNGTGTESWDLRAEGGRELSSGVYLYMVSTKTARHVSRFAVIK
ncbi:MAG: hypothetical protein QHJ34_09600 [bacterium]|jgi:hypothetical protein|nr:hypothetical protein [candidate division KSB1 bacterium]MDH7560471.1 hypothetical protein [bacterium]